MTDICLLQHVYTILLSVL